MPVILSTTLILVYSAFCIAMFFASIDIEYIFTAIVSLISFCMIFFTPKFWDKVAPIKYWKVCVINILIILTIVFLETAWKMV